MKITKVETFLVKPRWIFLKIHTDEGLVGLGEPILEGRALTCATAVNELAPYLIGKDPTRVVHHWQAMYRHAFYRGGPLLTSALSGVEQALWDLAGKALGVPVYKLLGGPTRDRIRIYKGGARPDNIKAFVDQGWTAFKTGVAKEHPARIIESKAFVDRAAERFAAMREAAGPEVDIAIDFHGAGVGIDREFDHGAAVAVNGFSMAHVLLLDGEREEVDLGFGGGLPHSVDSAVERGD